MKILTDDGGTSRVPVVPAVRETRYARHGLPKQPVAERRWGRLDLRND